VPFVRWLVFLQHAARDMCCHAGVDQLYALHYSGGPVSAALGFARFAGYGGKAADPRGVGQKGE
jgi:hypothetical protein